MAYYAWTTFRLEVNEWGMVESTITPGEEVTQSQLDVDDEEWEEMIASGAIREEEYPDVSPDTSPAEYARAQAGLMMEETAQPSDEALAQVLLTRDSGTVSGEVVNADTLAASSEAGSAGEADDTEVEEPAIVKVVAEEEKPATTTRRRTRAEAAAEEESSS
jgi:hypothetical protein